MPEEKPKDPAGGQGPEPPAQAPAVVRVKIGGQEFELPASVAEAFDTHNKEFARKLSEQGDELGQLRRFKTEADRAKSPPADQGRQELKPGAILFEDPDRALDLVEQRIVARVTQDYRRDQGLRTFWDGFYRANDDLREDSFLVDAVFQQQWDELKDLKARDAQEKLAELTRKEILRIAKKAKTAGDGGERGAHAESSSGPRQPKPSADEEDDKGPKTLSEVIRARRQQRREAQAAVVKGGPGG